MKRIRTVLLGLGRIAWMLERDRFRYHPCTHAGTLHELSKSFELAGACDPELERRAAFAGFWKTPVPLFARSRDLFERTSADLAVIAASLPAHASLVKEAVKSGVRGIVLEKPPALTYAQTKRLVTLSDSIPVWVNFERRYHPSYVYVKRLVESEHFGPIRSIRGRVLVGSSPGAGESGPLLHDAIHWIDLLLWFAGPPIGVNGRLLRSSKAAGEHTAFARFDYPEFSAVLESGGRRRYFEFEMEIDLAEGRILCGNSGVRIFVSAPSQRYAKFRELREQRSALPAFKNPWIELYREVTRVLRGRGTAFSSLDSALAAMKIVSQLERQR